MLKITGLNVLNKKLEDLANKTEALDGKHNVPLNELLTPAFVSKHTRFENVNEMFNASGFKIETQEDFAAIPDDEWDQFIRSISPFPDWQAMLREAGKEWVVKKLGF
ncbi:MAG TPA: hypothetical protein EYP19_11710 [Desulfobacterales bacterium]|nr:hypothetical protein [Desulfobacterales bacterium]